MNLNLKYWSIFTIIASVMAYVVLGYFFPRENFLALIISYSVAFFSFFQLYKSETISNKQLLYLGIIFRTVFLFGIPFWSQDFYRFIWDGKLIANGLNPYLYTPNQIIATTTFSNAQELYDKMGTLSAAHFSNYPPVNQLLFAISSLFSDKSIFYNALVLKIFIMLSDIGIYHYGSKILLYLNQNSKKIFLYFLNPLVIIELTGNLHFEGVMLFFFTIGLYYFLKEKLIFAAVFIAISISTKLLTLLLLPFFYQKLGLKKSFYFYGIIIGLLILTFLPFYTSELVANYTKTLGLWFSNFEFNASIYYVVREIGFYIKGYNIIGTVGKITPVLSLLVILFFALVKRNVKFGTLFSNMLIALSIYFFIATTVHPWYSINLVFLSIFTRFKFPIAWSYLIILSYFAYYKNHFEENFVLLFIEYGIVFSVFIYECLIKKKEIYNG